MKIKEGVTFSLNKDQNVSVRVRDKNIGCIQGSIYNLLILINGVKDKHSFQTVLRDKMGYSFESSDYLYNLLISKFSFILENSRKTVILDLPMANSNQIVYPEQIKALVPQKIVISLTQNCFMNCRYCYANAKFSDHKNSKDLSLNEISNILDQCVELGIYQVDLTGGDPFIRNDIYEILRIFESKQVHTNISTKKLLTTGDINRLKEYTVLDSLQISLDTYNDDTQLYLVGVKKYSSKHIEMIKDILKKGITLKINAVITNKNINEIPKMINMLESIGVKELVLSPYSASLGRNDVSLFPEYDEYNKLYSFVQNFRLEEHNLEVNFPKFMDINEKFYADMNNGCSAGKDGFVIGPDGKVAVCERLLYKNEYSVGDTRKQNLLEIWNSKELEEFVSTDYKKYEGTKCEHCPNQEYCIKQRKMCYVHSLILNNKLYSPDNACKYNTGNKRVI